MSRDSDADIRALLRQLPKVDTVVDAMAGTVAAMLADTMAGPDVPRWALVQAVRDQVEAMRRAILAGTPPAAPAPPAAFDIAPDALCRCISALLQPSLRRAINATGVVLHTNLGRAPLGDEALDAVCAVAAGYSNLEYDLAQGRRGSRHGHVSAQLQALTGAEDAVVVNNNAGAVLLALAALATDREVVVSRGELVEIGGSFRVPDVMRLSGARLVEVGTTNKTRAADYRDAAGEHTGLLLKVHQSNFVMVGFTEEVSAAELAGLGRELGVATMVDLGSGFLLEPADLSAMGLPAEPGVRQVVAAGVDVVSFSGDKLLGGPQAGILCGRAEAIARIRRHPLMRALRPDKMTLAALEATLSAYRDGRARERVPAVAMLGEPAEAVRERAEEVLTRVRERLAGRDADVIIDLARCASTVGGGAMPLASLPSWALALAPAADRDLGSADIDRRLRRAEPPVIGRVADGRVLLDLRTVRAADLAALVAGIAGAAVAPPGASPDHQDGPHGSAPGQQPSAPEPV